jgi:hypothetical protein
LTLFVFVDISINEFLYFWQNLIMAGALKYMVDENGDKTSVLVPIRTWEKMNQEYTKLQNKLKVFTGINEGLTEVKEARKSGKKMQNLKDFLRESNS